MFELEHGYIPFDRYKTSNECLYYAKKFQEQFGLKDPKLRLIIPAVHGNDFITPIQRDFRSGETLQKLFDYRTCEDYLLVHTSHHERFNHAEEQYSLPTDFDPAVTIASSEIFDRHAPPWVIEKFRKGCFQSQLFNVCINSAGFHSS